MDNFQNGVGSDPFDPLTAEPVNEKPYSQSNVRLTQDDLVKDIPEPIFMPPPMDSFDEPFPDEKLNGHSKGEGGKKSEPKKKEREPLMPEMNDLPDDEKEEAAEKLAETIVDGYEWVKGFGNSFCKIPEKKMRKAYSSGEIAPNVQIPWTGGEWVMFSDFVQEFNETAESTLKVDPKFRKKVIPPLTRVLKKRGAGISDEAYIAIAFGQDLAISAGMIMQMRSTIRDVMQIAREQTELARAGMQPRPQPAPQAQQYQQAAPQYQPQAQSQPTPPPVQPTHTESPYMEPEEHPIPPPSNLPQHDPDITMYTEVKKHSTGFAEVQRNEAMPSFGNPGKLAKMEKVHTKESKRQKRATGTRDKMPRKGKRMIDEAPKKRRGRPKKNDF